MLELHFIARYMLDSNYSQNAVVFRSRFTSETKKKICSDNVKNVLLPNDFPFQILFILRYDGSHENMKMKWKPNTTQNILVQPLLVHF